ncbi:MAG: hypothetical protein WAX69_22665 [Victivallales bacterium]
MKIILKHILPTLLVLAVLQIIGCRTLILPNRTTSNADNKLFEQKCQIVTAMQGSPDTDAWHEQRQKLSQAMGDRVFDKDFGRVYDSLVLAISNLELKVINMERTSGYIQASGITLPPTESKAIRQKAVRDWCGQKGFDPSIPEKPLSPNLQSSVDALDNLSGLLGTAPKAQKNLTFQLVKMGDKQTKVKLRFSDVFYPPELESYYKIVWQAVDKQIFVDQNIEGAVESRAEPITVTTPVNEKEKGAVAPVPAPALNP